MLPRTPPTQVPRTYVNRPPPGSHLGKSMTTTTYATFTFVTKVPLRCLTTDLTMTTYVTRHFCYALRGRRQRLTVASSFSSLGHCEGASKAVSAVRAATSFSPLAFQFHLFQSARLLLRVGWGVFAHRRPLRSFHPKFHSETAVLISTERMSFSGFTGGLNKVMHALNGNIFYQAAKPKPHCSLWRDSFYLPNGMTVFRYAFRLWQGIALATRHEKRQLL